MPSFGTRDHLGSQTPDAPDADSLDGGSVSSAVLGRPRGFQIPPKLYRIGELVDFAGISRQTVHNYATMGLLRECRWTQGGHRLFDEDAFRRLAAIAEMKAGHKSMQDIRDYFKRLDAQQGPSDN